MGKFDIDSKYDENVNLSLTELCREIYYEIEEQEATKTISTAKDSDTYIDWNEISREDNEMVSVDAIYKKFKNPHQSGLLDKLKICSILICSR